MELRLTFPVLVFLTAAGVAIPAQQPMPGEESSNFTSETTEVLVPALVRDAAGKVVYTLQDSDFVLTDDGVPQELTLQQEMGVSRWRWSFGHVRQQAEADSGPYLRPGRGGGHSARSLGGMLAAESLRRLP